MKKATNKTNSRSRSLLGFGMGLCFICLIIAAPSNVFADPILELNPAPPKTIGPQSMNSPCIIAGTNCQNPPDFPYTNYVQGGNIDSYDVLSPVYSIDDFDFLKFDVAIDVNTAKSEETLLLFKVLLDPEINPDGTLNDEGTVLYYYDAGEVIGLTSNAGNAWADWILGTIDLSDIPADSSIVFWASWNGATGGAESFFLINDSVHAPEPTSLLLLGSGLAVLSLQVFRRRRKR